ncbi:nicotinamide-nucleotide amidase [Candidatus Fukatsuia anoeciicola]|uniref:nicotinamide-nucleotide amidase n=1 Tax=Candidatus Fukatsuia anoeciicola TaxID=2994492 RepID=UPI0034646EB7
MNHNRLHEFSFAVGEKLRQRKAFITCAESCTGGWIAKAITDIPNSSMYFDRGYVTYSNIAKHDLLDVSKEILLTYGAVSAEVVKEMALGALNKASADFSLSVSGFAGSNKKDIFNSQGKVWFGFAAKTGEVITQMRIFHGNRESIRMQATVFSLKKILEYFL